MALYLRNFFSTGLGMSVHYYYFNSKVASFYLTLFSPFPQACAGELNRQNKGAN